MKKSGDAKRSVKPSCEFRACRILEERAASLLRLANSIAATCCTRLSAREKRRKKHDCGRSRMPLLVEKVCLRCCFVSNLGRRQATANETSVLSLKTAAERQRAEEEEKRQAEESRRAQEELELRRRQERERAAQMDAEVGPALCLAKCWPLFFGIHTAVNACSLFHVAPGTDGAESQGEKAIGGSGARAVGPTAPRCTAVLQRCAQIPKLDPRLPSPQGNLGARCSKSWFIISTVDLKICSVHVLFHTATRKTWHRLCVRSHQACRDSCN